LAVPVSLATPGAVALAGVPRAAAGKTLTAGSINDLPVYR
jgi:hypothetical protein